MLRIPHYLSCAAGAATLLLQTGLTQAHVRRHAATSAYQHRLLHVAPQDIAGSPFYGPFGGYADPLERRNMRARRRATISAPPRSDRPARL